MAQSDFFHPGLMMLPILRALFLLTLVWCIQASAWADETDAEGDYRPGKGWQIPGTGFRLGGYADVAGIDDVQHKPPMLGIDNLSLFVHWEGEGKLRLFSEIDLEVPLAWERGNGVTSRHSYLALERLYGDYLYSEKLNVRAGKFLTPVGRWNVIHADPLVWTTSRPLVTEHSFPTNATGAMLYGTVPVLGKEIDYSAYASLGDEWRPDPKLDPFKEALGAHFTIPVGGNGELGLSYVNFEQQSATDEHKNLVGVDYFRSVDRYEISAEAIYRFSDQSSRSEKGMFVQGVVPIYGQFYAVARYEWFDPAGNAPAMNISLLGLAMKPSPATIIKAEFSHASHNRLNAPEGFFTSFAILF